MITQDFDDYFDYTLGTDLKECSLSFYRREARFNAVLVLAAAVGAIGMLLTQHWVLAGLYTACACASTASLTVARRAVRRLTIELITLRLEQ